MWLAQLNLSLVVTFSFSAGFDSDFKAIACLGLG